MIFEYIWNLLIGYVIITVEGLSVERLINIAAKNGIRIWDVKRTSYASLRAKTSFIGYRKLLKNTDERFSIKISKSKGIPGEVKRLFLRKALFFGFISIVLIVSFFSMFYWQLEIKGAEEVDENELLEDIVSMGLSTPMLKRKLDLEKVEDRIIIEYKQISWANFTSKGIKLCLEVVETNIPDEPKNPLGSSDVVARKDGYITKVLVFEGNPAAEEGQTVKRGQTLINGEFFDKKGNFRVYDADGMIYADIWYMGQEREPLYEKIDIRTGRSYLARYLLLGKSAGYIGKRNSFDQFETEIKGCVYLGENLGLPIKVITEERFETVTIDKRKDKHAVKRIAKNKASEIALEMIPDGTDIIKEKVFYSETEDMMYATVFYKTNENIAEKVINE